MNTIMNLLSNLMDILSNLNGSTIFFYTCYNRFMHMDRIHLPSWRKDEQGTSKNERRAGQEPGVL